MVSTKYNIQIPVTQVAESKIGQLDFENLGFGKHYGDHMFVVKYQHGEWSNPEIVPFEPLAALPSMSGLHYGQTIFEGMKAFRNIHGKVQLFRPLKNWERMNRSASRLCMPNIPEELFMSGLTQLLRLDEKFVPGGEQGALYIRPFLYATDEYVGVKPSECYTFVIFTSPAGPYYAEPVKVKFERKYVRACQGGVGAVKMGGNYASSMLATHLAKQEGYHNVIWLDAIEHKYVEECGTMNIFFVIDGKVITPSSEKGTILDGITRDSVIILLQDLHIPFEIRDISTDELIEAHKKGLLQEAFGTGTAVSLAPVCLLGDGNQHYNLLPENEWKIIPKIKTELEAIRLSKVQDRFLWNFPIS